MKKFIIYGLDYMVEQIDTIPTTSEIVSIVEKFFYGKYFYRREHEDFPRELVGADAIISINKSFEFEKELNKLDITTKADSIFAGFVGTIYNHGCDTILDSGFYDQITKYNKKKATARRGAGSFNPIRVSKGSMISYHHAHSGGAYSGVTEISLSDCD